MKKMKLGAFVMSALMIFSGCGMNNTAKGGLIGGGAGAGIGALVGNLIGRNAGGTLAGAAIGAAVGTGAGLLIGKKMDKLKAQAEAAVANGIGCAFPNRQIFSEQRIDGESHHFC